MCTHCKPEQWYNRWGVGGQVAQCPPLTFFTRKFLLTNQEKKRQGQNGKWRRKEGMGFFFFFFLLVTFSKPLKFVWGLPNWKFLPGKRAFHAGKKSGKVTLPSWKVFLLCLQTSVSPPPPAWHIPSFNLWCFPTLHYFVWHLTTKYLGHKWHFQHIICWFTLKSASWFEHGVTDLDENLKNTCYTFFKCHRNLTCFIGLI